MNPGATAIVLLGAGRASRFGGEKILFSVAGRRVVDWALSAALESGLRPVILVTRPDLAAMAVPAEVRIKATPESGGGLSASIRCGIQAAGEAGCQAVIFAPTDQPLLCGEVYQRLVRAHQTGHSIVAASFHGRIRNPVLLDRGSWDAVQFLEGDQGLSELVRTKTTCRVECTDISSVADIDTQADLIRIQRVLEERRKD